MCSTFFIKTLLKKGGIVMTNEKTDSPNTIKYSIWNTRTDEPLPVIKEKIVESMDKPTFKSKTTESRD
jgi:hypothetical protein